MTADDLNKLRIFPRICLGLFSVLCYHTANWFMNLESPSVEQTGFVSTIFLTLPAVFKFYMSSGGKNESE